ncbi:MAG: sulfur carrier protein ThiS [Deltaproteobacteria bacterium]|nr:sulfur carrier protein ThiS [Deltaproteobacteria bacterium]
MVLVNNRDRVDWQPGMTVQDLLDKMGYSYVLITVTVDDALVAKEDYASFPVPDGAAVTVFHLAHGG